MCCFCAMILPMNTAAHEQVSAYLKGVKNLKEFCRATGLNYKTAYRIKTGETKQIQAGNALLINKAIEAYEKKAKAATKGKK